MYEYLFCSLLDEFPVDHRNVKLKAIKERSVNIINKYSNMISQDLNIAGSFLGFYVQVISGKFIRASYRQFSPSETDLIAS